MVSAAAILATETTAAAVSLNASTTIAPAPMPNTAAAAAAAAAAAPANGVVAYGHRLSTVVPGAMTAEGVTRDLSGVELALKLHYIRGVYLYESSPEVAELDSLSLKAPMFTILASYYPVCARIGVGGSKAGGGRPFLKCNDSGVRIVEAKSDMRIDLLVTDLSRSGCHSRRLIEALEPQQVLGPQFPLSPLALVQFTRFKCGGLAVGFSWSHILGDAVSVASFFNAWAKLVGIDKQLLVRKPEVDLGNKSEVQLSSLAFVDPDDHPVPVSSVKQVDLAGGCWVTTSEQNKNLERLSFHVTDAKLKDLLGKVRSSSAGDFEAICAAIWQCVARIRTKDDDGPTTITVCRPAWADKGSKTSARPYLGNRQAINTARYASARIANASLSELARLVAGDGSRDETQAIGDHVAGYEDGRDGDAGQRHYILYGANLTFVDMRQTDCYALKLKGQAPILANYDLFGVGNGGVVIVLPGLPDQDGGGGGRMVNITLPADEITGLKQELANGGFFGHWTLCEQQTKTK